MSLRPQQELSGDRICSTEHPLEAEDRRLRDKSMTTKDSANGGSFAQDGPGRTL